MCLRNASDFRCAIGLSKALRVGEALLFRCLGLCVTLNFCKALHFGLATHFGRSCFSSAGFYRALLCRAHCGDTTCVLCSALLGSQLLGSHTLRFGVLPVRSEAFTRGT